MKEMINFKCVISAEETLTPKEINSLNITYPEVHNNKAMLLKLTKALKSNKSFCELPFCHTLEAENLGADIHFGNSITGPRAGNYKLTSFAQLQDLPGFDFTYGRMSLLLQACKELANEDEIVLFNVSGPFTILSTLLDPKHLFKALRKNPSQSWEVFDKLQIELLNFLQILKENKVKLISFSDSVGSVDILGPKLMREYLDRFVIPFTKKAQEIAGNEMVLILCPKLTYALSSTNRAQFNNIKLSNKLTYAQAITSLIGKNVVVGEMCLKDRDTILQTNEIKTLVF